MHKRERKQELEQGATHHNAERTTVTHRQQLVLLKVSSSLLLLPACFPLQLSPLHGHMGNWAGKAQQHASYHSHLLFNGEQGCAEPGQLVIYPGP